MKLSPHLDTTKTDPGLVCPCGCGMGTRPEHWRPELPALFEAVRAHVGLPILAVSGWRCPRHNARVSKAEHSQHGIGAAIDLACPKGMDFPVFAGQVEYAARTASDGQAGVGTYPLHATMHVDLGLNERPGRRWSE